MIISDGYNGTPSGFENCCEDENNVTKWYVLHAEANAILKVGGYGPLWDEMNNYVQENNLHESIILLGKLSKSEIALEMNRASAFLHNSNYETFSVVCAESPQRKP